LGNRFGGYDEKKQERSQRELIHGKVFIYQQYQELYPNAGSSEPFKPESGVDPPPKNRPPDIRCIKSIGIRVIAIDDRSGLAEVEQVFRTGIQFQSPKSAGQLDIGREEGITAYAVALLYKN